MYPVFKDNSAEEFLRDEHKRLGLNYEELQSWIMNPPSCSTFRINTLKFTKKEAIELITKCHSQIAKDLGLIVSSLPKVNECCNMPDVLIIDSWQDISGYSVPDSTDDAFVIVDTFCGAAILRGSHLFAPGVLALPKGSTSGQNVSVFADLDAKCLKGSVDYKGSRTLVGKGILKMEREVLFNNIQEPPKGIAVWITWTPKGLLSLDLPPELGQLQNLPSSAASWELNPQPGDCVLDMCASPGNKTSHLAALMKNQGTLIAIDRSDKKCDLIRQTCGSFGAACSVFNFDSTKACSESVPLSKSPHEGPPFHPKSFDKILLDAPCNALGQRPQLSNKISAKQMKSCPALQKKLFRAAVDLLKPGGSLVYCTCSITFDENEGLVQWALSEFGNDLNLELPRQRLTPAVPLRNFPEEIHSRVQRFGPPVAGCEDDYCDSIGFFISRFLKNV